MTRTELALLSQAHAVALTAMVAPETRAVPMAAAYALRDATVAEFPDFRVVCAAFCEALRHSHGRLGEVAIAGRALRDAVARFMVFVPVDASRVDIHG